MTLDDAEQDAWAYTARCLVNGLVRTRSQRRLHAGRVPFSYVAEMMREQDYRCAVTGFPLEPRRPSAPGTEGTSPWQASLDRIDNDEGYCEGNVRVVCLIANLAMNRWGPEPLRTLMGRTAD